MEYYSFQFWCIWLYACSTPVYWLLLRCMQFRSGFPVWLKYVPGISFRTDNEPFKVGQWNHLTNISGSKDENGTEISRTEPHRFLYLIRSNLYFLVRVYRFRFRIWDVSYFKCKSRKLDLVRDTFSFVIIVMLLSVCADGNAGFHWENCGNDEERKPLCIPRWPNYPLSGKYNRLVPRFIWLSYCIWV